MKLPKPLFAAPSRQGSAKTKKKRKKPRVTGVYNELSGEFSHESRDDDCVDPEGPEHLATGEVSFDALREFARLAAMPGATVYTSVEGGADLCERLGVEFYAGGEPGEEEEKRRLIANVDIEPEPQDQEMPEHARHADLDALELVSVVSELSVQAGSMQDHRILPRPKKVSPRRKQTESLRGIG